MYFCHLFLISYASIRPIPFLSFIEPIFAWKVPLVSLIFLKRSLVFPILLFSSISLHWSLRKAFYLSLLFFGTLHSHGYIFPFRPLLFASLLFTAICKASSDSHFVFLHFFFLGMVLIPVSCSMSPTMLLKWLAIRLKKNLGCSEQRDDPTKKEQSVVSQRVTHRTAPRWVCGWNSKLNLSVEDPRAGWLSWLKSIFKGCYLIQRQQPRLNRTLQRTPSQGLVSFWSQGFWSHPPHDRRKPRLRQPWWV